MMGKRILVAPLNWGLGHATRCVPVVHELILQGFEVVLASDGLALDYLAKEFPKLEKHQLAPLHLTYAKKKYWQAAHIFFQIPKLYRFIAQDQIALKSLLQRIQVDGIISDCRPGVFMKAIPSVYINHQLNVLTGITTQLSSYLHHQLMNNFDEIWVPDYKQEPNLSGILGHLKQENRCPPIRYLGWLNRMQPHKVAIKYDYCAVLSGPEPQRSIFEGKIEKLFDQLQGKKICITGKQTPTRSRGGVTYVGMLNAEELNQVICASGVVICRSGYTSIMDLVCLQKPALLVPTPGQPEQEYLAKRMMKMNWFLSCHQNDLVKSGTDGLKGIHLTKLPKYVSTSFNFSVFH